MFYYILLIDFENEFLTSIVPNLTNVPWKITHIGTTHNLHLKLVYRNNVFEHKCIHILQILTSSDSIHFALEAGNRLLWYVFAGHFQ